MTEREAQPSQIVRTPPGLPSDPTGVPHLDDLLGGGLPRGSLAMIVGPPGSGKTTLASQIAFTMARAGRRALILTAFSEPAGKLLGHLRGFTFFDEDAVGDTFEVISLEQFLPGGLVATADELWDLTRQARASLVMLDGFRGIHGASSDGRDTRAFLYRLSATLNLQGTTTLITSEAEPRDTALFPEVTTGDVLIGIHYGLNGMRQRRAIEAIKVRGAAPLPGLHPLRLDENGASIYPRLETRAMARLPRLAPPAADQRAAFGLPELDALLNGGLPTQTNTLVLGSVGTGKTLLGLHFSLAGIAAREQVLYLSFREMGVDLLRAADSFDLGPRLRAALAPGGGMTLIRLAPVEIDPDLAADVLLKALDGTGARRLVIDGIGELEAAVEDGGDKRRLRNYLSALVEVLRVRGVTTICLKETGRLMAANLEATADEAAILADNVLFLQQLVFNNTRRRMLSVVKVRYSSHDVEAREFRIVPPLGIRVLKPAESETSLLDQITHQRTPTGGDEPAAGRRLEGR